MVCSSMRCWLERPRGAPALCNLTRGICHAQLHACFSTIIDILSAITLMWLYLAQLKAPAKQGDLVCMCHASAGRAVGGELATAVHAAAAVVSRAAVAFRARGRR